MAETRIFSVRAEANGNNDVTVVSSIDGKVERSDRIPAVGGVVDRNAVAVALRTAGRIAQNYSSQHSQPLTVVIDSLGEEKRFSISPSGRTSRPAATPPKQSAAQTPAATLTRPTTAAPRAAAVTRSHRPTPPAARHAQPQRSDHRPSPPPRPPAWNQPPAADPEPPTPQRIPVTDKSVRAKKTPLSELPGSLWSRFAALTLIKKVFVVLGIILVVLLGSRIVGGGSSEYRAVCVDQRTGMRQLDSSPCTDGKVRFFVWYYVDKGEDLPPPNTDYSTSKGTFDKPTSGTITYS